MSGEYSNRATECKRQKDDVAKRLATGSRMQQSGNEKTQWHRDAELIKARMKKLKKTGAWSKGKKATTGAATVQSSLGSVSYLRSTNQVPSYLVFYRVQLQLIER